MAVYDQNDHLTYAGHVGTGLTELALRQLHQQLVLIARGTAAVGDVPREHARRAHWVEPALVGEVAFRTWTPENRLRHASWRGLRTDRAPASVRRAPPPIPAPPQGQVEGAYRTRDGRWRIEVVRRGRDQFFRVLHGENIVDGLDIAMVEELLEQADVSMAALVPADVAPTRGRGASGAA